MDVEDRLYPVTLFGTLLEETPFRWHFAPEDELDLAFWLSKRYGSWRDDFPGYDPDNPRANRYPREGEMTLPRWIARKRKCIAPPPDDEDPAWLDIARLPRKYFAARKITVTKNPNK